MWGKALTIRPGKHHVDTRRTSQAHISLALEALVLKEDITYLSYKSDYLSMRGIHTNTHPPFRNADIGGTLSLQWPWDESVDAGPESPPLPTPHVSAHAGRTVILPSDSRGMNHPAKCAKAFSIHKYSDFSISLLWIFYRSGISDGVREMPRSTCAEEYQ